jgi:hypothetical protein
MTNTNPKTGIRYGYIHADALHPDIVHELLYGFQAVSLSCNDALAEYLAEARRNHEDTRPFTDEFDEAFWTEELSNTYEGGDEECIEGTYEGVSYCTSYLGGALNFFICESPITVLVNSLCSPCVPNAGDLDSGFAVFKDEGDSGFLCYGVPGDWLDEERA